MELPQSLKLLLLLLFTSSFLHHAASKPHNNFTDVEALLAFKSQLIDPHGILASNWTANTSFCNWLGITCTQHSQRVFMIYLRDLSLQGTISPHLSNLSFLTKLVLCNLGLTGSIPSSITRLPRLKLVYLIQNALTGTLPFGFFNMSQLVMFDVALNSLSGTLPSSNHYINLPRLQHFQLTQNQFIGEIPTFFDQCKSLRLLDLVDNNFTGNIPTNLGNLSRLQMLTFGGNKLTGTIPGSLGNLTDLLILDLSLNMLRGVIPWELGNLLNLQYLSPAANDLTGSFPTSLLNASMLNFMELSLNFLTGPVPSTLGKSLPLLQTIAIGGNQLTGGLDFMASLSNCKTLFRVDFPTNNFEGVLPSSVGNLSTNLTYFAGDTNKLEGKIPPSFGNLSSLISVHLENNKLTGEIPDDIGRLEKLQFMSLENNRLSGQVPSELGLIKSLDELFMQNNKLIGPIPDSVGNLTQLQHLSLSTNKLTSIPSSLWNLASIIELNLSNNALDGLLPPQIGNLKVINILDLSANQLSGNISSGVGQLHMLSYFDLSNNLFQGQIPQSVGGLINVKYLNLSNNFLTGSIPKALAHLLYLSQLDLSFNKLEGQIPQGGVFSNLSISSLEGNRELCGASQLGFSPCSYDGVSPHSRKKVNFLVYILSCISFIVVILASVYLVLSCYRRKRMMGMTHTISPGLGDHRFLSHLELARATGNFNEENLLGRGSFSSVFKGCLDDGLVVAVKVLNLDVEGAANSFDAECQVLRMVRHRNLVKIISVSSNLDFKALVLQFMSNGSLDQLLYSGNNSLNVLQRLNIMVDVSMGLEYLHHNHPHILLHCDLKPSNVLLDEEMVAHVGDFGISKLLVGNSQSAEPSSRPGTIGYIAPEYGCTGMVSRMGDVYSFGILLMETFTRKKPASHMFDGELTLREWIRRAHPRALLEVVDINLLKGDFTTEEQRSTYLTATHHCLSSVIELGLLCSNYSPKERIPMEDVVPSLQKIKVQYMSRLSSA